MPATTTKKSGRASLPASIPGPQLGWWERLQQLFQFGRDSVGYAKRLFDEYGQVVALSAGGGTRVLASSQDCPGTVLAYGPENTRTVTTQHDTFFKGPLTGDLYPAGECPVRKQPLKLYGTGLFAVNSDEHRRQRRLMMPAFHRKRIESYRDDMVAITDRWLSGWKIGQAMDLRGPMSDVTKRIASKCLLGEDLEKIGAQPSSSQMLQHSLQLLASPWTRLLPYDWPGMPYRRLLDLVTAIHDNTREMIQRKRELGSGDDVLSMLIEARYEDSDEGLSEDELIAHTGVIFAAGHETSANALTWTLFLLSQHPEIHREVVEELRSRLAGAPPTVEQLQELPMLEAVVKESLRVLPPVPWNARITSHPTNLGGHELPEGTEVLLSIYQTQHMAEIFPEPERFNPRRWETIEPSPYEYNPFSAGPRMCIGATFAMMEIKIVLSILLQRFRLALAPDQTIDRTGVIVMSPKHGVSMRVCDPDQRFAESFAPVRGNVHEMVTLPQ